MSAGTEALRRAVRIARTQGRLGDRIGKSQAHVAMWMKRGKVPAEVCADIESATDGKVTCEQLRPDVFKRRAA